MAHAQSTPDSLAEHRQSAPSELVELLQKMLAKNPSERPCSATEVASNLEKWTRGSDLTALVTQFEERANEDDLNLSADEGPLVTSKLHSESKNDVKDVLRKDHRHLPPWQLWMLAAIGGLLLPFGLAAVIVITIRRDNQPDATITVPDGSEVTIGKDGGVEVKLPKSEVQEPPTPIPPRKAHAPTFQLSQPEWDKQEPSKRVPAFVAFSPNGKLLATSDADESIYLWDVQSRKLVRRLRGPTKRGGMGICPVAFSPDGNTLATGGRQIIIWDVATGRQSRTFQGADDWTPSLAFSPNGKLLASSDIDHTRVFIWEVDSAKVRFKYEGPDQGCIVHFSRQGKFLVACDETSKDLGDLSPEHVLVVPDNWDLIEQGSPYSPHASTRLAFMDKKKSVLGMWDTKTEELIDRFALKTNRGIIRSVAVSRDKNRLAVSYCNGQIEVWILNHKLPNKQLNDKQLNDKQLNDKQLD
jgi:WD40 repeat protein